MENATKALLIAAAVLVAILIISLGLVVYNMASETIDSVNFSGQEVTAFNDQFTHYQGKNVRGSEINAMLKTVLNSNMKSRSEGLPVTLGQKYVQVTEGDNSATADGTVKLAHDAQSSTYSADTSKLYSVSVLFDESTGFVKTLKVDPQNR